MPFSDLFVRIFAVALPIVLASVIVALALDRRRVRRRRWRSAGLLDCIEQSLRNLTAMQTTLQSLAQEIPMPIGGIGEPVRQIVSAEIQACAGSWTGSSRFRLPFLEGAHRVRPFPPLANEMRGLVQQAVRAIPSPSRRAGDGEAVAGTRRSYRRPPHAERHSGRADPKLAEGLSSLADAERPESGRRRIGHCRTRRPRRPGCSGNWPPT